MHRCMEPGWRCSIAQTVLAYTVETKHHKQWHSRLPQFQSNKFTCIYTYIYPACISTVCVVIEEEHAISTQKGPCLQLNPEPSCKVTVLTVPLCTTTLTTLKEKFRKHLKWKVRLVDIIMACTRAYIFLWSQMILVSTWLYLCEW